MFIKKIIERSTVNENITFFHQKKQTAAQEQVQSEKDCFLSESLQNGIIRLADQTYAKMYAVPDTQRSADVKRCF